MNGTQTKELERKFNERLIQENKILLPKELEKSQSIFAEKLWRGKVYINEVLTAILQDDLKSIFKEKFKLNKASQGLDPKFLTDNPRMTTSLHNDNLPVDLRGVKDEKLLEKALNEFAGDAWQNLSSLLWQDPIGSLDRMFVKQTELILQDASKQNALTAKVKIRYNIVHIEYENKRFVNHLLHAGNSSEDDQQNIPLDERVSHVSAKFGFSISLEDLGRGKVDSLEIVGEPFVYCTICPGIRRVE